MARVKKFQRDVWPDENFSVVGNGDELVHRLDAVLLVVHGLPIKALALALGLLLQVFRVAGLNAGAVHYDKVGQVARRAGGVKVSVVSFFCQNGDKAAVVKMSVGQDHGFQFFVVKFKVAVLFVGLAAVALKGSAVNHVRASVNFQYVFAASNFLGGAE